MKRHTPPISSPPAPEDGEGFFGALFEKIMQPLPRARRI